MTWTRRSNWPSGLPCCTMASSLSTGRARRWSPMRARARSTLATDPVAALSLAGINTLYGDSHVLHEVAFSLAPGRLLALLGRNGAGKTTCMSTIIGFVPPRDGVIELFGEPVTRLSREVISRKGVALVPQGRRIFPSLSVRENLQ